MSTTLQFKTPLSLENIELLTDLEITRKGPVRHKGTEYWLKDEEGNLAMAETFKTEDGIFVDSITRYGQNRIETIIEALKDSFDLSEEDFIEV